MIDLMWNAIEISVNIYQGFICAYFVLKFLSPKPTTNIKLYYLLSGGLHALLITVLNYLTVFEGFASVLYILELLVFAVWMLNGNIVKKIIASIIPLLTGFLISTICLNFFSSINHMSIEELVIGEGYIRAITLFSIQSLYFICFKIILKLFATDNDKFDLSEWKVVISITVVSIIMIALLHTIAIYNIDDHQRIYINLAILILLTLDILTYYLIGSLIKKNSLQHELDLLRLTDHYHKRYLENANLQNESIRKIRHDLDNTLSATYKLLSDGDIDAAMTLVSQNRKLLKHTETYISSNNRIVNAVINSKFASASAMGIQVSCLSVNDFDGIDEIDLCNLLSNTLDNAIAACLKNIGMQKWITVDIYSDNDMYTFTIKNSIEQSVLDSNPELKTTKHHKSGHGYGTQIIKDIANKYNGRYDFYEQGNMFCCKIILQSNTSSSS